MKIRTKDLPMVGAFGHARSFLYGERLWEITVKFVEKIGNLGCSYDDHSRVDVVAYGPKGVVGGWRGKYGGSYAMMYDKGKESLAAGGMLELKDIPEDTVVLEINRHYKGSWVTMYVNPIHEVKLLPSVKEGINMERMGKILKVFSGLISSARQSPLNGLKVTEEEFGILIDNGWLKCHKGKRPQKLDKPVYVNGPYGMYKYYELNGAQVTTEGKNVVETTRASLY